MGSSFPIIAFIAFLFYSPRAIASRFTFPQIDDLRLICGDRSLEEQQRIQGSYATEHPSYDLDIYGRSSVALQFLLGPTARPIIFYFGDQFEIEVVAWRGYAVELYFDPALENQVLKAWNVLARRQISTKLIEISARPHLTLLSVPSLDPLRLQLPIRTLAARLDPLPLSLSSVGAFPSTSPSDAGKGGGGVLFLAPTPSAALLHLHSQVCDALRKEGIEPPEEFRPDSWVPHCSVAQDVPRNRIADAFCILRDLKLPVSGYAMDIGLVEFSPVQEIFSFPLGSNSES
ncbi:hypothetical protein ZIOFF_051629 [Zingiber officinale]|uniref:RNA ligase/cyclic nucleotide phosphodiesterase family protein n=1 Tax=Zingiber officinale TaxID=94328 RepID=A0A8J5KRV7_ZINOF|nr:hypothetical protein ZIOFF_051629 [Zingiber officinale]